jgi:hypothetical protein
MAWPPRVRVRPTAVQRRKHAALKARNGAPTSSAVVPNDATSGEIGATKAAAVSGAMPASATSVPSYAFVYCTLT